MSGFETEKFPLEIRTDFFLVITFMLLICDSRTVLISLFSSLFHECGHLVSMLLFHQKIDRVLFSASGMRIDRRECSRLTLKAETVTALSGVFVNFCLAFVSYMIFLAAKSEFFLSVTAVNLVIGVFNLLPVESLDGGNVLRCILISRIPVEKAESTLTDVSITVVIMLIIFFAVTVFTKTVNPSLTVVLIYLVFLLINRILELKKSAI